MRQALNQISICQYSFVERYVYINSCLIESCTLCLFLISPVRRLILFLPGLPFHNPSNSRVGPTAVSRELKWLWQAMASAVVASEVSADPACFKMRISSVVISRLGAHKIARLRKALKSMAESPFHGSWHTTFKHTPFVHGSEKH